MKIFSFIKKLLPWIKKDDVLIDIEQSMEDLEKLAIPAFAQAASFFKASPPKSAWVKKTTDQFYTGYKLARDRKSRLIAEDIHTALSNMLLNLKHLTDVIEKEFGNDILSSGITIKKAFIIRAAAQTSFCVKFSTDFLNAVYSEIVREGFTDIDPSDYCVSDKEKERIAANVWAFSTAMSVYGGKPEEFMKVVYTLSTALADDDKQKDIEALYRDYEVDPFSPMLADGFTGSPIYFVKMVAAEWQAKRYKLFVEKKKMLELRLMHLKILSSSNNDPSLEKDIAALEKRVETLEYELHKMES